MKHLSKLFLSLTLMASLNSLAAMEAVPAETTPTASITSSCLDKYCAKRDLNYNGTPICFESFASYAQIDKSLKWLFVSLLILDKTNKPEPCKNCLTELIKALINAMQLKSTIFYPTATSNLLKSEDPNFTDQTFVLNLQKAINKDINAFIKEFPTVTLERQGFPATSMGIFQNITDSLNRINL